jgi:Micrococcal nuclease (thermonuclease) homologs
MKKLSLNLFSIILFSSIITSAISFEKIIIGKAYVTDGDTIKINDQKIRLFGIDAPETKQFCKEVYLSFLIFNFKRDYKCGEKSTNALKKKIQGKNIRCLVQNNKDRYRRNIGICYLKKQDINSWLVKNGYAIAYRRYSKKYINDEQYAEDNKLGIWQGIFMKPEKWRRI